MIIIQNKAAKTALTDTMYFLCSMGSKPEILLPDLFPRLHVRKEEHRLQFCDDSSARCPKTAVLYPKVAGLSPASHCLHPPSPQLGCGPVPQCLVYV